MLTDLKIQQLANRAEIPKYTKYKENNEEAKHLVKFKKIKDYEYYICDFCGEEIKITKNHQEMSGGIVTVPASRTKSRDLELVLHNKCLNLILKEFDNRMIEKNYNHIPSTY